MIRTTTTLLCLMTTRGALGQPTAAVPEFDVASVRLAGIVNKGGERAGSGSISASTGQVAIRNAHLIACIKWAYGVSNFQLAGERPGPERYDILAKSVGPAPVDELRLMLRSLLADRFKLTLHHEQRTLAVQALVIAKNGPKLQESTSGGSSNIKLNRTGVVAQSTSISELGDLLSGPLRIPVLDRTGLQGRFDFTLVLAGFLTEEAFSKKGGESGTDAERSADLRSAVSKALQAQLGLRLESQKGPVDMLIIDHIERASEN